MSDAAQPWRALVERLYAARRFGVELGLDRMTAVLDRLGNPERRIGVRVHIAGTNGKGSTAAFVDAMARGAGCRTGRFTSPHLVHLRERFVISGVCADPDLVIQAGNAVTGAGGDTLTFFEQVTAMALWIFAAAAVDVAIIEVGLGGRLDATNAVACEVAAVTGVAFDHEAYLGTTIEAIAGEKAGIFKPHQRAVVGCSGMPEARPLLRSAALRAGVQNLTMVDAPVPSNWMLGLAGEHQRANAACALAIVDHLHELGAIAQPLDQNHLRQALAQTRLPGRLERLDDHVVVDGAHNPHAACALAAALPSLPRPRIAIVAVSADKDAAAIVAPLLPHVDAVIATTYQQARARSAQALADIVSTVAAASMPVWVCEDVGQSLDRARSMLPTIARDSADAVGLQTGTIVVTGSLFIVGEVQERMKGQIPDDLPLSDPLGTQT